MTQKHVSVHCEYSATFLLFECKTTCMIHCHTTYLFLQIMPTA